MEKQPSLYAEEEMASSRRRKQVQLGHLPTVSLWAGSSLCATGSPSGKQEQSLPGRFECQEVPGV